MDIAEREWIRLKVIVAKEFGIQPSEMDRMSIEEITEVIRMLGEMERARKTEEALLRARGRI